MMIRVMFAVRLVSNCKVSFFHLHLKKVRSSSSPISIHYNIPWFSCFTIIFHYNFHQSRFSVWLFTAQFRINHLFRIIIYLFRINLGTVFITRNKTLIGCLILRLPHCQSAKWAKLVHRVCNSHLNFKFIPILNPILVSKQLPNYTEICRSANSNWQKSTLVNLRI